MTTDAIFSIASMTKPMVAAGALQLYERGLLQIEEPVSKYLPQFGKQQVAVLKSGDGDPGYDMVAAARQPSIRDLMLHTSGIIYGGRGATAVHKLYPAGSAAVGPGMTGQEVMDKLAGLPLLHSPARSGTTASASTSSAW
jgi:CubicO group peptidase (beta-lactamase class C family)